MNAKNEERKSKTVKMIFFIKEKSSRKLKVWITKGTE